MVMSSACFSTVKCCGPFEYFGFVSDCSLSYSVGLLCRHRSSKKKRYITVVGAAPINLSEGTKHV